MSVSHDSNARQKIAIVTGGNRGLGYETSRQLAQKGIPVILTSRDEIKGREATERLAKEGLPVSFRRLDVSDSKSIDTFVQGLKSDGVQVGILVNNAGVMIDDDNESTSVFKTTRLTLRTTMETNVYGALELSLKLIPLMGGSGRIVNLSSGMGQLSDMDGGYPAYRISKASINVVTRVLASELQGTDIKVNSVSPGWVKTDMGGPGALLTPEQGVRTVVWLATLPSDGPTAGFFDEDQEPMEW